MFGNNTTTPATGSLFGGGGTGAFGQQNQQKPAGTGLFGQQSTGGLFGQNNQQQQQSGGTGMGTGLFGQSNTGGAGTGLFGQNQNQQQQQQGAGTGTGPFGQSNTGGSLFGQNNQQQQQQQGGTGTGMFGQNNAGGTGTGLFGQNNQQQQGTGNSLFGQSNTGGTGMGLFGQNNQQQQQQGATGGGLFGQSTTGGGTGTGLFGQNNQSTAGGGLFGQNNQQSTAGTGLFGQNTGTGLFGQSQQQQPQQQQSSLFGGGNTQQNGSSLWGKPAGQQQPHSFDSIHRAATQIMRDVSNQQAPPFTKTTKFNDLPDEMKRFFEQIDTHIQGRVQISKELHQRKLGEEATKGQELVRSVHRDLAQTSTTIRNDLQFTRDLKAKADQAVQDTIVACRVVDGFKNTQANGGYLKDHASFPLEFFTRITRQTKERLAWYKSTIEQIERKLSSMASQPTITPQRVVSALQAQHATFLSLAGRTATIDADLQKIKAVYTQLWRARTGSVRDPFDGGADIDEQGLGPGVNINGIGGSFSMMNVR
ncbi:Nucleoporin nup49/NSP49 (Nuclear pore protein nup49/NSP49) [Marasmius sp. AFHP31]|nr:Nucleoporin nup49/NSP49 (Nuclear pore protein nup49/NSP49) [Marasmius sp. AFHP31]